MVVTKLVQKWTEFLVMYWGITLPENACLRTCSVCPQSVSVTVFPISVSVLMFVLISVSVVVRVFPLTVYMSVMN
jgi:hypothetical protein